ncbi:MAG: glycosyltransferase family 4 protein [Alphaproteobacteria bacterium]
MKVALLLPSLNQGGVETSVLDLASYLQSQKNVTPIVISEGGKRLSFLKKEKIKHIKFPAKTKNPIKMFFNVFRLTKILKKEKIDILHAHSRAPAWVGWFASKKTGVPFLTTFHGIYGHKSKLKKIYNSAMLKGEKVIAVSKFTAEHIKKNYPISKKKIITIPRWIDLEKFSKTKTNRKIIKSIMEKYNLQKHIPIITMVGRIRRLKGQDYFIKSLVKIRTDFRAVIIGDGDGGDYEKNLHKLVKENKLEKKVIFVGDSNDIPEFLRISKMLVSATSTKPETFGLTILEAMAMGVLVVATAHGGSLELVNKKRGGLVNPCDENDLANGIKKLLKLPEKKYKIMQKECIGFAKNFSRDKMCKKVLATYLSLREKSN